MEETRETYIHLVQGDIQGLCEILLCIGVWFILLLEVRFQDVMLLLCKTRLDVARYGPGIIVIHVWRLFGVVIAVSVGAWESIMLYGKSSSAGGEVVHAILRPRMAGGEVNVLHACRRPIQAAGTRRSRLSSAVAQSALGTARIASVSCMRKGISREVC